MKKSVFAILFGLVCGVLFCLNSKTVLSASATNDLVVRTTKILTSAEAAQYSGDGITILPGDYKVTVSLENNTLGICMIGAAVTYNGTYFSPIASGYGDDVYIWDGPNTITSFVGVFRYNPDPNVYNVSVSCMRATPYNGSGELVNFFLRPNSGSIPSNAQPLTGFEVERVRDENHESLIDEMNISTTTYYEGYMYLVGDVDGDGAVTLDDALCVAQVLDNYGSVYATNPNAESIFQSEDCDGMFSSGVFVFLVADVNADGVVNTTDQNEIQSYYTMVLLHTTGSYTGLINSTQWYYVPVTY